MQSHYVEDQGVDQKKTSPHLQQIRNQRCDKKQLGPKVKIPPAIAMKLRSLSKECIYIEKQEAKS
ncbi:hypothetical protein EV06_1963 [Prochlorococcus sp. MIT 0602]|nr:hypothetical protein EV06_1963 [Prochlorococcus sp. MIT 0602]